MLSDFEKGAVENLKPGFAFNFLTEAFFDGLFEGFKEVVREASAECKKKLWGVRGWKKG